MRVKWIGMMMVAALVAAGAESEVNVRALGAVGDGKADDTAAVQKGLDLAKSCGGLYLPPGDYRITKTLKLEKGGGVTLKGQAGKPWSRKAQTTTTLLWDGEKGGLLLDVAGSGAGHYENLNLDGHGKAGTLMRFTSPTGWGNMLHKFDNIHLIDADVGVQCAAANGEICNSDMLFNYTTMKGLKTGLLVNNDQGVDFTFNFLFGLNCGTIVHFVRGGNLLFNTAQLTDCDRFLEISGGGRNAGTFLCNNVRIEGDARAKRFELLKSYPRNRQAVVKFVGYDDVQWQWSGNHTASRLIPLCDVGPGTSLTIESSIFNGPVASLTGLKDAPASLVTRECSFGYVKPETAIKANEFGYFKLTNCFTDSMAPLPDVLKWPSLPPLVLDPAATYCGKDLQPPTP